MLPLSVPAIVPTNGIVGDRCSVIASLTVSVPTPLDIVPVIFPFRSIHAPPIAATSLAPLIMFADRLAEPVSVRLCPVKPPLNVV